MNTYRQGDILFKQVKELPCGVSKKSTKTVALGEVTGHSHRFEAEDGGFE